jgi:hypothetical protein
MRFYLLWHDRSHHSDECRWFREQIVDVIREKVGSGQKKEEKEEAAPARTGRLHALA